MIPEPPENKAIRPDPGAPVAPGRASPHRCIACKRPVAAGWLTAALRVRGPVCLSCRRKGVKPPTGSP
jgi:hypothetical protein